LKWIAARLSVMNRNIYVNTIIYLILLSLVSGSQFWQKPSGEDSDSNPALYVIQENDNIAMKINIWGEVEKPGQYIIPFSVDPDMITLLSIAGGPTSNANLKNIRIVRVSDDHGSITILVNLSDFLDKGNDNSLIDIEPNDTIIIGKSFLGKLNSNHSILNILNLFTTIYLILSN